jgi:hypothetical protein
MKEGEKYFFTGFFHSFQAPGFCTNYSISNNSDKAYMSARLSN